VRAITGFDENYIWHKYSYALGLQCYSLWWQDVNNKRQVFSPLSLFAKLPDIVVLSALDLGEDMPAPKGIIV
jgi:hypothetical protein